MDILPIKNILTRPANHRYITSLAYPPHDLTGTAARLQLQTP